MADTLKSILFQTYILEMHYEYQYNIIIQSSVLESYTKDRRNGDTNAYKPVSSVHKWRIIFTVMTF